MEVPVKCLKFNQQFKFLKFVLVLYRFSFLVNPSFSFSLTHYEYHLEFGYEKTLHDIRRRRTAAGSC
jgi:hypothetical protein